MSPSKYQTRKIILAPHIFSLFNPYKPIGRPFCATSANNAIPDQRPQNAVSNQVLHCLQTEFSFKI